MQKRHEIPLYRAIGARIAVLRLTYHMPQAELAERIGCSRCALSLIENGKQKITVRELILITKVLHVSLDVLLAGLEEYLDDGH
jgi:transcriptional regulator with XRE-family HTH domain